MQETLRTVVNGLSEKVARHVKALKNMVAVLKEMEANIKRLDKDVARLYVGSGKTRSE